MGGAPPASPLRRESAPFLHAMHLQSGGGRRIERGATPPQATSTIITRTDIEWLRADPRITARRVVLEIVGIELKHDGNAALKAFGSVKCRKKHLRGARDGVAGIGACDAAGAAAEGTLFRVSSSEALWSSDIGMLTPTERLRGGWVSSGRAGDSRGRAPFQLDTGVSVYAAGLH